MPLVVVTAQCEKLVGEDERVTAKMTPISNDVQYLLSSCGITGPLKGDFKALRLRRSRYANHIWKVE